MSDRQKVCVICGEDCSQRPRIKNSKGQYACKACAEAKQAKENNAEMAIEPEPMFGGLSADMLDDIPQGAPVAGSTNACPGCGMGLPGDAVICTSCGMNLQTGKSAKTKTIKAKEPSALTGAAASTGGALAAPIVWTIGGAIGGAVGAAAWAACYHFLDREISYVAIGVGLLTGVGVNIAARGGANAASGGVAVIVAVVALLAGKYAGVKLDVDEWVAEDEPLSYAAGDYSVNEDEMLYYMADDMALAREEDGESLNWPSGMSYDEAVEFEHFPDEIRRNARQAWDALSAQEKAERLAIGAFDDREFIVSIADSLVKQREASGETLSWPAGQSIDTAYRRQHYPPGLWDDAESRWNGLDSEQKADQRETTRIEQINFINENMGAVRSAITEIGFLASFRFLDILWFGIAIVCAFGAGSRDLSELSD